MPTTEHIHLPLYTDEETPDLSTTGHYNHAMEIIDANAGELEQKDAELAEDIADERDARVAEVKRLDGRVDTEAAQRVSSDNSLLERIEEKADQSALDTEIADRTAADTALEGKVSAETAAREAADAATNATLAGKADSAALAGKADQSALDAETAARDAEDKRLAGLIADETAKRMAQDETVQTQITATNSRIDNAEAEISANSADLTGIKGLTYGTGGQVFLEEENGEYSSPALEEIQHEIKNAGKAAGFPVLEAAINPESNGIFADVESLWPNVVLHVSDYGIDTGYYWPAIKRNAEHYYFFGRDTVIDCYTVSLTPIGYSHYWGDILNKPFSTIGSGLKVVSNALTVDASALPSGITVISVTEGNEAADVYAKVQADWPNCVLLGANYMYPVQETPDGAYLFSTICLDTMYVCWVTSTNIQTEDTPIVLPGTTFGDLTAGVTS